MVFLKTVMTAYKQMLYVHILPWLDSSRKSLMLKMKNGLTVHQYLGSWKPC